MVRQVRRGQRKLVCLQPALAVIEQVACVHNEIRCDDRPLLIRHHRSLNRRIRARTDLSGVVDEHTGGHAEVRTGQQFTARVVQRSADFRRQAVLCSDRTCRVVEGRRPGVDPAIADDLPARIADRVRPIAERQRARPDMRDRAAIVDQRRRRQRQVGTAGLDHAARRIVDRVADIDVHRRRAILRDRPVTVPQIRRGQCELIRLQRASTVVEQFARTHAQRRRGDRPAAVRHRSVLDRRIRIRADPPAVVFQRTARDVEVGIGQQLASGVVECAADGSRQAGLAADHASRIVQRSGSSRDTSIADDGTAHIRHSARPVIDGQRPVAGMRNRAAVVDDGRRRERQVGTVALQRTAV
ncbi:hypothetical protein FEP14_03626 [Burkholderia multivorans]|nr:hypothetical protein [Burkholderia multivorans]